MWQAISTLLRDWHTEDAEIELKTELPGGEIHSAWHLRFGGKDYFVKCDERELRGHGIPPSPSAGCA